MAHPSTILLVISLLSITFTISSAQNLFSNVTLGGVITCPNVSLATARVYRGIPLAKVDVLCGLFSAVTKSTTTNLAGVYSFSFSPFDILFNNPELCRLNVTYPQNSCTFTPPGGVRFPIIAIRSIFGVVLSYIPGAPTFVPA